jgi:hypothetical protein
MLTAKFLSIILREGVVDTFYETLWLMIVESQNHN